MLLKSFNTCDIITLCKTNNKILPFLCFHFLWADKESLYEKSKICFKSLKHYGGNTYAPADYSAERFFYFCSS